MTENVLITSQQTIISIKSVLQCQEPQIFLWVSRAGGIWTRALGKLDSVRYIIMTQCETGLG